MYHCPTTEIAGVGGAAVGDRKSILPLPALSSRARSYMCGLSPANQVLFWDFILEVVIEIERKCLKGFSWPLVAVAVLRVV